MFRTVSRIVLACTVFTLITFSAKATVYTFTSAGGASSYTLFSGDSLSIASGTFTGTISNWSTGAKITVAQNAVFNPSSFNFLGTLTAFGRCKLPRLNGYFPGLTIHNYYQVEVTGDTYFSGGAFYTYYGAVVTLNGTLSMQNSAGFYNRGFVWAKSTVYTNGCTFNNLGNINVEGDVTFDNNTSVSNSGKLYTKGKLTVQSSTYSNSCRTIVENSIRNLSGSTITNNGLIWASSAKNNAYIENQATMIGVTNSVIKSVNLTNFGTIRGSGKMYLTGYTRTTNRLGSSGTTTDSIYVRDVTRTGSQIFDNQSGNIYNNVVFNAAMAAPDTLNDYPNCSPDIVAIPLAVKWDYFEAKAVSATARLDWAAEPEAGSVFTVERSYDNANFTTVENITAEFGKTIYNYTDARVNTQNGVVFYRIKVSDAAGKITYSVTRTVKFENAGATVSVHAFPNPFSSQLSVQFNSSNAGQVQIRVVSLNGQTVTSQNATVNSGANNIAINNAAGLVKGMYMLQVIRDGQMIASEKIIRQ